MPPKPSCECGTCTKCYKREWARQNPEVHKRYVQQNYERVSTKKAEWRRKNRDRINEQNRAYQQPHHPYQIGNPKTLARKKALYATNTGKLEPQPCETCGEFPLLIDGRRGVW